MNARNLHNSLTEVLLAYRIKSIPQLDSLRIES
nr:MAG TPA: hypothetical protein [Caudoviricetes sp.]